MHALTRGSLFVLLLAACGSSGSSGPTEPRYTIIHDKDQAAETGGIPPDKEAEIQLVLQNREPTVRKCYQDVLNEKHDRSFQGSVRLLISLTPSGSVSDVKIVSSTLKSPEVEGCLTERVKEFEFPQLTAAGQVQYEYAFRPAY
jgi:hypothetical protein